MRETHCLHHVISDAVGSVRARVRITGPEALGVRPGTLAYTSVTCRTILGGRQRRLVVEVDPRIDTEIGDYRIEALLRTDDTGRMYLAEDVRLNRRVALRLLNPELAADERFRERFLRELGLVASLDHPNIVAVSETGEVGGYLIVAMGYVDGAGLASLLEREGRLEPERTLLIVTQLAEALDAARWSRGLVHGNLTPSDVLVAPDAAVGEHVYLLGFGIRQELSPGATLADATRHFGAVDYLAPEQIEGKPVSPRADVYALGCLLFECLTGRPPFKRDSPDAVLKAHLHEQPPSATQRCPDLPAGIDRVIRTALAKWPEERHSTCGELAAAAQAALAPGAVRRERVPMEERVSPVGLVPLPEPPVQEEPTSAPAMQEGSVDAPDTLAQRLRRGDGRRSQPSASSFCSLSPPVLSGSPVAMGTV